MDLISEDFPKICPKIHVSFKFDKNNEYSTPRPMPINPLKAELNPICCLLAL
jgi:hypothetical protein